MKYLFWMNLERRRRSAWVKDTVSYIINYRYAESKVTIFATNLLDKDEPTGGSKGVSYTLEERIGAANAVQAIRNVQKPWWSAVMISGSR